MNPAKDNVYEQVMDATGGTGVDVILEMSGHPDAIRLGFKILRLGGQGVTAGDSVQADGAEPGQRHYF